MSLKVKLYGLMALLHGGLLIAAYVVLEQPGIGFIALELLIIASFIAFIRLLKQALSPLQYLDLFKDLLQEQQYNSRFSLTGSNELDQLMRLFNKMLLRLYHERLKVGDTKGMLQQLMNAIPNAIIVFDHDDNIAQLNPAAQTLLQVYSHEIKGQPLSAVKHGIVSQLQLLASGEPRLLSDGAGKRYRCQRSNFRDKGFERQFIIIQELTADLQLSEKNTYQKLIRLMSHEVNNTMAATGSLLKSCLYYTPQIAEAERQDYQDAMHLVIERTDNLNQFMQDFANMVRLPQPSLELCNLHHMLMSTARLFEVQLKQRHIECHFNSLAPEQAQVMADRNQIEQVLINIVKNAMEAVDQRGQIWIELTTEPSDQEQILSLKVKDSGCGITESSQQQLFTPFYTTKPQGQGLGLMLVREILSAHQLEFGLFNWTSEQGLSGACFSIRMAAVE